MNVILKILDDSHIDIFQKMPFLWSMVDNHWTRFARATYNNPYCGPSRGSMNTGRTCSSTGIINHGIGEPSTIKSWDLTNASHMLPTWLRDVGYRNGHVGKWLNGYPWSKGDLYIPPGNDGLGWSAHLDDQDEGGIHNTAPYIHTPALINYALVETSSGTPVVNNYATGDPWTTTGTNATGRVLTTPKYFTDKASVLAREFMTNYFLSRKAYYNFSHRATHGVIIPANRHSAAPSGGLSSFPMAPADVHLRPSFNQADGPDWNTMPAWIKARPMYNSTEIADFKADQVLSWRAAQAVDESIYDMFQHMKAQGTFDDTVFIFMSDNGWERGEHRLSKKNNEFAGSINNEIWIRHPNAPLENRVSTALVQNVDIAPTICEIAGARPTRPFVGGQSFLKNVLSGSDVGWRDTAFIESYENDLRGYPGFKAVVTNDFKYVETDAFVQGGFPAENALYDIRNNSPYPDETRNVINDIEYTSVVSDMAQRLAILKKSALA